MGFSLRHATVGLMMCASVSCAGLVDVDNPGVIEDEGLDPVGDGRLFSLSARQDLASALGWFIVVGAFSTGEAISAESMSWPSEFERRDLRGDNTGLLSAWVLLSAARASGERVVNGLLHSANASSNIDLARASLVAGYAYLHMAEAFCEGAADGGPLLSTAELLDRAISHFTTGMDVGMAAFNSLANAEGREIALASQVGRARARLQQGMRAAALEDAQAIPANFQYMLWYSDDPSNAARLQNPLWFYTAGRGILSIAPAFRDLQDSRVPVAAPVSTYPPFDGLTPMWTQRKYPSTAASIRLASGLEAQYIAAEASQSTASMLALIEQRRAAGGQAPYSGATDAAALLRELMEQRARDFFLEGKRMGDARRNPGLVRGYPRTGDPYHKPGFAPVASQTCWPLPDRETARFPAFSSED